MGPPLGTLFRKQGASVCLLVCCGTRALHIQGRYSNTVSKERKKGREGGREGIRIFTLTSNWPKEIVKNTLQKNEIQNLHIICYNQQLKTLKSKNKAMARLIRGPHNHRVSSILNHRGVVHYLILGLVLFVFYFGFKTKSPPGCGGAHP